MKFANCIKILFPTHSNPVAPLFILDCCNSTWNVLLLSMSFFGWSRKAIGAYIVGRAAADVECSLSQLPFSVTAKLKGWLLL